ncbi:hypothetical protein BES34_012800 [Leptospira inadai serovar Lyme]|uniref:Uncharacterized protein n=1 Tax=Leptospira inadai serovar Lyme TaxID=293084 RepID=A0ABX4YH65_9LEPT|nr:hypothetical protein BES34_012800 [Leptospira inadai serovar Lyme]
MGDLRNLKMGGLTVLRRIPLEPIELFYNRQRSRSLLGDVSPVEFSPNYLKSVAKNLIGSRQGNFIPGNC